MAVIKKQVKSLVGKHVYVMTRQGQVVDGILQKFDNGRIYLHLNKKPVSTSAFTPFFNPFTSLALFDLLAISTTPFFFGSPFFF
ncbi:50S ribosomal protein L33 [Paenibacillus sp. LMG 31456]|uniref:50S ribosomal protein L33 n=1 Tax=Paenibacillus foliorum TaxID=2654974 RepID=A0A972GY60_9BACL|nr:50S ribosomal protein L33 [Paenibacillus foliorum]NOU96333.1 50S ribosomal protein L33 [Paenibacillus foliorum]